MTLLKIALVSTAATLLAAPAFAGAPGQSYTTYNTGSYGSSELAGNHRGHQHTASCNTNTCRPIQCYNGQVSGFDTYSRKWTCVDRQPSVSHASYTPLPARTIAPRPLMRAQQAGATYAGPTNDALVAISRNRAQGQVGAAFFGATGLALNGALKRPNRYNSVTNMVTGAVTNSSTSAGASVGDVTAQGGAGGHSSSNADAYNSTRVDVNQDQLAYAETGPINVEGGVGPAGPAGGGQDSGNLGVSGPQDSGNLGTSGQGMGAWTVPVGTVTQPNIVPGSEEDLFGVGPDGGYANGGQIGYNGSGTQPTGFVLPNPQYIQPIQPVPASNVPTFGSAGS